MSTAEFPAPIELLPHRGKSLLIDRIVEHEGDRTAALVTLEAASWLARDDGSVPPWLAIEFMAQCAGAHESLIRRQPGGAAPKGYLVGVTKLRLHCAGFRPGEQLRVRSHRVGASAGLGVVSHRCEIQCGREGGDSTPLAEGRISLLIPRPDSRRWPPIAADSRISSQAV